MSVDCSVGSTKRRTLVLSLCALVLVTTSCGVLGRDGDDDLPDWENVPGFQIQSEAFRAGESIPIEFTCDGDNVSPPLAWSDPPDSTVALALIVDDPDAPRGTFTHWILFNIPASERSLAQGAGTTTELPDGTLPGDNGYGEHQYRGPCPPEGEEHRYRFTLYALDGPLDLEAGASRGDVIEEIRDHIVGGTQLVGRYQRP